MNTLLQPVCVECRVTMRCHKNGQLVNDPEVAGFSATYWSGDMWRCPQCGHRIVKGTGEGVLADDAHRTWDAEAIASSISFTYQ